MGRRAAAIFGHTGLSWWEQAALENRLRRTKYPTALKNDFRTFQTQNETPAARSVNFKHKLVIRSSEILTKFFFFKSARAAVRFRNYTYLG